MLSLAVAAWATAAADQEALQGIIINKEHYIASHKKEFAAE